MKTLMLSDLTIDVLLKVDVWKIANPAYDGIELLLLAANKSDQGVVLRTNGEVWCLSKAIFFNGTVHHALAMCDANSDEGPLLWSVWNGGRFVPLFVPPAPAFVLEDDGPEHFCKEFDETTEHVFPIALEVVPRFEVAPTIRRITIYAEGAIV
jgi:hypothetical protein